MASWNVFRRFRDSSSKVSSRQPPSIRLNLEFLEPRLAPATFTVMDNSDSAADTGSLRFALANVASGTTIDFAPSVRDIVLTSNTTLTIGTNVNIVNDLGTGPVTIDGNNGCAVFTVNNGVTASLSGLTITHGNALNGSGISNSFGTLTISDCTFIGNHAIDNSPGHNSDGGAIESSGTITIDNCTFSTNTADQAGGAIDNHGELTVSGSTFVGNSTSLGGGSAIVSENSLTVNNCTFADNSSGTGGGAITNVVDATITDSTFSGNTVAADLTGIGSGGGVFNIGAMLTLNGDILVGNTGPSGYSDILDQGAISPMSANNVVGVVNTQTLTNGVNGNQVGVTPAQIALGPLADNGGPTQTFALLPGSVAIGMGQTGVDPTDQRGDPRPATTRADAGAFQTQANTLVIYPFAQPDTADRGVAFTGLSAQERYVQAIYLDELGRVGAQSELDGWVTVLNGPGGATAVAGAIDHSFEARDHLVQSWYLSYLNRQAVGGEELGWVNLLRNGQTEEQVLSQILGGAEFYNDAQTRIGGANAQQNYVQALYQVLLNRTGEPDGAAGFVNALPQEGTQGVALDFLQSAEFRTGDVEAYYSVLLNRPADPAGLNGWVFSNLDVGSVRIAFEATSEFFTNG